LAFRISSSTGRASERAFRGRAGRRPPRRRRQGPVPGSPEGVPPPGGRGCQWHRDLRTTSSARLVRAAPRRIQVVGAAAGGKAASRDGEDLAAWLQGEEGGEARPRRKAASDTRRQARSREIGCGAGKAAPCGTVPTGISAQRAVLGISLAQSRFSWDRTLSMPLRARRRCGRQLPLMRAA